MLFGKKKKDSKFILLADDLLKREDGNLKEFFAYHINTPQISIFPFSRDLEQGNRDRASNGCSVIINKCL